MNEHAKEPEGLERRAAHERLSTGALSRWTHLVTRNPWRVILS